LRRHAIDLAVHRGLSQRLSRRRDRLAGAAARRNDDDCGYGGDWLRQALSGLKITPCIAKRSNRTAPITCNAKIYKRRSLVERMFGRLDDWRRFANCYNRHLRWCNCQISAMIFKTCQ
jgi:transposase